MKEKAGFSLDELNLSSACDIPQTVDMNDVPMFEGKNIKLQVVGVHSERVRDFSSREANKKRAEAANNRKKNGFTPIQDDIDYFVADAAIRIVGWEGINAECNLQNAKQLCSINKEAQEKVVRASNDMGNFTKSK